MNIPDKCWGHSLCRSIWSSYQRIRKLPPLSSPTLLIGEMKRIELSWWPECHLWFGCHPRKVRRSVCPLQPIYFQISANLEGRRSYVNTVYGEKEERLLHLERGIFRSFFHRRSQDKYVLWFQLSSTNLDTRSFAMVAAAFHGSPTW